MELKHLIGIDIDTKERKVLSLVLDNCRKYGEIKVKESKHGYHIWVKLFKPVSIKNSFWLRFHLGDDSMRLLFDAMRYINGSKNIDILWDNKERKKIMELMKDD